MKRLFLLSGVLLFLSSCDTDSNGNMSINGFGILIIVAVVFLFIILGIWTESEKKETKNKMKEQGVSFSDFYFIGDYIGGIPNKNEIVKKVYAKKSDDRIELYTFKVYEVSMPESMNFSFNISDINNITVEDKSSIDRRLTVGRIFLVGIYAFAWKKKKKEENAYLLIEWNKGKFTNTSVFSFEGKDAFLKANKSRNDLINMVS